MAIELNTNNSSILTLKCLRNDLNTTLGEGVNINQTTGLTLYSFTVTTEFANALKQFKGRLIPIGGAYYKDFTNNGRLYYPFSIATLPNTTWSTEMNTMQLLTKKVSTANNQLKSADGFVFYFLNLDN